MKLYLFLDENDLWSNCVSWLGYENTAAANSSPSIAWFVRIPRPQSYSHLGKLKAQRYSSKSAWVPSKYSRKR